MKLASFETIVNISPIEGADRIELATIQGWQSVVKKGDYKIGDQVIFVPIDTVIRPEEWNKFLWNKDDPSKPIRIKTMKMKGVVSQGVIFPKSLVSAQEIFDHMDDPTEDVSLAGILGITKYEKPIPASLAGKVAGDFPSIHISKTDEDNLKSNIECLNELKQCDEVVITLKIDGTSATYIKDQEGNFKVCSRNLELKEDETNAYWKIARKYNLKDVMKNGTAIQGEIAGPNIQGNPLGLNDIELFIFNYKNLETGKYIDSSSSLEFNILGVKHVPKLSILKKSAFQYETIETLQEFANNLKYDNGKPAEGIVLRGMNDSEYVFSKTLCKMLSVKIINQNFKD